MGDDFRHGWIQVLSSPACPTALCLYSPRGDGLLRALSSCGREALFLLCPPQRQLRLATFHILYWGREPCYKAPQSPGEQGKSGLVSSRDLRVPASKNFDVERLTLETVGHQPGVYASLCPAETSGFPGWPSSAFGRIPAQAPYSYWGCNKKQHSSEPLNPLSWVGCAQASQWPHTGSQPAFLSLTAVPRAVHSRLLGDPLLNRTCP